MTITIKTIIGYDPVTEKEEIEQFIANTDISKWSINETTTTTCFERTERWFSDKGGGMNENENTAVATAKTAGGRCFGNGRRGYDRHHQSFHPRRKTL